MLAQVLRFFLAILLLSIATASLRCLDGDGKAVDWFIGIKVPDYIDSNKQNGKQYFLITPDNPSWTLSDCTVKDSCGAIYSTMQQLYNLPSGDQNSASIMYNDEHPEDYTLRWRSYYTYGHMKGALGFSANSTGFWLIHSVPKFSGSDQYSYPNTGLRYGQHFMCITFGFSELPKIAHQLSIARPNTYGEPNVPRWLARSIPDLDTVANKDPPRSDEKTSLKSLTSFAGAKFLAFSKSRYFGADLYGDFLAPTMKDDFYMEGWVDGRGNLDSTCDAKYKVYRVEGVQLLDNQWPTTKDHSKWAVSKSGPWVCLGDINREKSQFKRGGGTVCLNNAAVWSRFRPIVSDYQECN